MNSMKAHHKLHFLRRDLPFDTPPDPGGCQTANRAWKFFRFACKPEKLSYCSSWTVGLTNFSDFFGLKRPTNFFLAWDRKISFLDVSNKNKFLKNLKFSQKNNFLWNIKKIWISNQKFSWVCCQIHGFFMGFSWVFKFFMGFSWVIDFRLFMGFSWVFHASGHHAVGMLQ